MISRNLKGVDFLAVNTDAQHLASSLTSERIQIGKDTTQGLGCGANPNAGKAAAVESIEQIMDKIAGTHMVFITAGMGGGTGTGAAPVIAEACLEAGILTVGVATKVETTIDLCSALLPPTQHVSRVSHARPHSLSSSRAI